MGVYAGLQITCELLSLINSICSVSFVFRAFTAGGHVFMFINLGSVVDSDAFSCCNGSSVRVPIGFSTKIMSFSGHLGDLDLDQMGG